MCFLFINEFNGLVMLIWFWYMMNDAYYSHAILNLNVEHFNISQILSATMKVIFFLLFLHSMVFVFQWREDQIYWNKILCILFLMESRYKKNESLHTQCQIKQAQSYSIFDKINNKTTIIYYPFVRFILSFNAKPKFIWRYNHFFT